MRRHFVKVSRQGCSRSNLRNHFEQHSPGRAVETSAASLSLPEKQSLTRSPASTKVPTDWTALAFMNPRHSGLRMDVALPLHRFGSRACCILGRLDQVYFTDGILLPKASPHHYTRCMSTSRAANRSSEGTEGMERITWGLAELVKGLRAQFSARRLGGESVKRRGQSW